MERDEFFTKEERELLFSLYKKLLRLTGETLQKGDCRKLKKHLIDSTQNNTTCRGTVLAESCYQRYADSCNRG